MRSWGGGTVIGSAYWFAIGMGMAVVSVAVEGRPSRRWLVADRPELFWAIAAVLYVLLSLWLAPTPFLIAGNQQVVANVAFGIIAALVLVPAIFVGRGGGMPRLALRHPAVAWLGLISYGVFLWHYAVVLELGPEGLDMGFVGVLTGTLAITIPCAAGSYYLVERPLLRRKYRPIRGRKTSAERRTVGSAV